MEKKAKRGKKGGKKRRVKLKEEKCNNQFQSTIREGTTYERDVGPWKSSDVEEIPAATAAPQVEVLSELKSMTQIMFDVETTSLGNFTIETTTTRNIYENICESKNANILKHST